jgi:5-formyltetrahydrofolate cyclo-ligase
LCRLCGAGDVPVIVDAVVCPTKTELRAEMLLARRTLAPQLRDAEAHALSAHLRGFIGAGQTVCAYVPVGSEPGSMELIDSLLQRDVRVLLPVACYNAAGIPVPLQWGDYRQGGLVKARFGLTARYRWPSRRPGWWRWSATTSSSTGCPPNRMTCG